MALFALLKIFAPRYDPWYLFYKTGLRELLIACGVRQPSSSTQAQDGADDEGAGGVRQPSSATPLRKGADDEGAGGVRQPSSALTGTPTLVRGRTRIFQTPIF